MNLTDHSRTMLNVLGDLGAKVCVIIVNYNSGQYLGRCLEALSQQDYSDFFIVVVDNASIDGSLDCSQVTAPNTLVIALRENIGFAAANNLVALQVTVPWIATLNPDAIPQQDWLSRMMDATERYPYAAMFGSTLVCDHDRGRLDGSGDLYSAAGVSWRGNHGHSVSKTPEEGEVFSACAAAALYRTDVFKSVGGFDEDFYCFCEDVDIAFRMRLLGNTCIQVKDSVAYHYGSLSAGRNSNFAIYHGFRNRLWTFAKNMPSPLLQLLILPHILVTFGLLLKQAFAGRGYAAVTGLRDGCRKLSGPISLARKQVQSTRRVSLMCIAKAMTWSPMRMILRTHDVRPVRPPGETRSF